MCPQIGIRIRQCSTYIGCIVYVVLKMLATIVIYIFIIAIILILSLMWDVSVSDKWVNVSLSTNSSNYRISTGLLQYSTYPWSRFWIFHTAIQLEQNIQYLLDVPSTLGKGVLLSHYYNINLVYEIMCKRNWLNARLPVIFWAFPFLY